MFSGNTPDPFFAQSIALDSGQSVIVDLTLPIIKNSGYSISGVVIDSIYGVSIDKGVVIVRKGTHTPTLLNQMLLSADSYCLCGFYKSDGSYNIECGGKLILLCTGIFGVLSSNIFQRSRMRPLFSGRMRILF